MCIHVATQVLPREALVEGIECVSNGAKCAGPRSVVMKLAAVEFALRGSSRCARP